MTSLLSVPCDNPLVYYPIEQYRRNIIPEQFTVKAHPALFEGERGEPENEALLFQSTVDINFQNAHKTLFQVDTHTFKTRTKHTKTACEGLHSMRFFFHIRQPN